MRKARTVMLEQGTQTPSPAPDLIPAETKNQARTNIRIGTANGGTSVGQFHPLSTGISIALVHEAEDDPHPMKGIISLACPTNTLGNLRDVRTRRPHFGHTGVRHWTALIVHRAPTMASPAAHFLMPQYPYPVRHHWRKL